MDEQKQKPKYYSTKHQESQRKYDKANMRNITLRFNLKTDKLILERLDSVENRQGYIKSLIIADIMRERMMGEDLNDPEQ